MADHGSQFFANEAEGRRRGEAALEAELKRLGIRHVMARIAHPQTNGKIERVHREIERRLASFEDESAATATRCDLPGGHFTVGGPFHAEGGPSDPIDRLVEWYNHERDHMSLDEGETPAMAYARKMPPGGSRSRTSSRAYLTGASRRQQAWTGVNTEQSRISYGGKGGCTTFRILHHGRIWGCLLAC